MSLRIVSLLPSATEVAVALGLEGNLVGRSHQCDFPAGVQNLPICTSTKIEQGLSSRAIEDRVKEIVTKGLSVYDVDAPLLRSLKPDVILTQSQCAVCAVTPADLETALSQWVGTPPILISTAPDNMTDVYDDFRQVGEAVGEADRAEQVVAQMRTELSELSRNNAGSGVRMLALEWLDPLMIAGNWVPELVEAAGAESLLVDQGVHSHWIEYRQIKQADPDVIVLMPCGYGLEQTLAEARPMFTQAPWSELRAVKAGAVYAVDGHHLFNRPGPRLVQSARVLAEIVRITGTADHALDRIDPALRAFIARI